MSDVTITDLRHRSADVLRRVDPGESLTVPRDGAPVAAAVPLPRLSLPVQELIARRRTLPTVDRDELLVDVDRLIDPAL